MWIAVELLAGALGDVFGGSLVGAVDDPHFGVVGTDSLDQLVLLRGGILHLLVEAAVDGDSAVDVINHITDLIWLQTQQNASCTLR